MGQSTSRQSKGSGKCYRGDATIEPSIHNQITLKQCPAVSQKCFELAVNDDSNSDEGQPQFS